MVARESCGLHSDDLKHPAGFLHTLLTHCTGARESCANAFIQFHSVLFPNGTLCYSSISCGLRCSLTASHLTVSNGLAILRYPMLSDAPIRAFRQNCFLMCVLVPASLAAPRPSAAKRRPNANVQPVAKRHRQTNKCVCIVNQFHSELLFVPFARRWKAKKVFSVNGNFASCSSPRSLRVRKFEF